MKISPSQLNEFKRTCREKFGQELTDEAALVLAQKLLGLVKLVYKPISKTDLDKFN